MNQNDFYGWDGANDDFVPTAIMEVQTVRMPDEVLFGAAMKLDNDDYSSFLGKVPVAQRAQALAIKNQVDKVKASKKAQAKPLVDYSDEDFAPQEETNYYDWQEFDGIDGIRYNFRKSVPSFRFDNLGEAYTGPKPKILHGGKLRIYYNLNRNDSKNLINDLKLKGYKHHDRKNIKYDVNSYVIDDHVTVLIQSGDMTTFGIYRKKITKAQPKLTQVEKRKLRKLRKQNISAFEGLGEEDESANYSTQMTDEDFEYPTEDYSEWQEYDGLYGLSGNLLDKIKKALLKPKEKPKIKKGVMYSFSEGKIDQILNMTPEERKKYFILHRGQRGWIKTFFNKTLNLINFRRGSLNKTPISAKVLFVAIETNKPNLLNYLMNYQEPIAIKEIPVPLEVRAKSQKTFGQFVQDLKMATPEQRTVMLNAINPDKRRAAMRLLERVQRREEQVANKKSMIQQMRIKAGEMRKKITVNDIDNKLQKINGAIERFTSKLNELKSKTTTPGVVNSIDKVSQKIQTLESMRQNLSNQRNNITTNFNGLGETNARKLISLNKMVARYQTTIEQMKNKALNVKDSKLKSKLNFKAAKLQKHLDKLIAKRDSINKGGVSGYEGMAFIPEGFRPLYQKHRDSSNGRTIEFSPMQNQSTRNMKYIRGML